MPRPPLSVLIHTLNEEDQIEDCLRSVEWADEIYLVDSHSTDSTLDIARRKFPGVRIEQRTSLGSAAQKNYAMDRAAHDWILVVDADERVTPELRQEILDTLEKSPKRWAYSIGRRNFILEKEVRFSGLQRDRVIRLFHRGHARYPNKRVHADLLVDGETGDLRHKDLHYYVRSLDHMIEKMTRYGVWAAAQLYLDGKRAGVWTLSVHTSARFVRDYFLNLGFLDGTRGLIAVGLHTYYTFWKYAKLWEFSQREIRGLPLDLPPADTDEARWILPWEEAKDEV
jgi:glycosyltransferase involved in cell wall biosynthesis